MITTVVDVDVEVDRDGDGDRRPLNEGLIQSEPGFVRSVDVGVIGRLVDGNVVVASDDVSFAPFCSFENFDYHHNGSEPGEAKMQVRKSFKLSLKRK